MNVTPKNINAQGAMPRTLFILRSRSTCICDSCDLSYCSVAYAWTEAVSAVDVMLTARSVHAASTATAEDVADAAVVACALLAVAEADQVCCVPAMLTACCVAANDSACAVDARFAASTVAVSCPV